MFNQGQGQGQSQLPSWARGLIGGTSIGEGIFNLFGGNKNPFPGVNQYLSQIPGIYQQYLGGYAGQNRNALNPYMKAGYGQIPGLESIFRRLMQNPGAFLNQIGAGYHASPGFQNQVNQAITAANRSAAAGGMAGSPAEQTQVAGVVNNLANQDYNQYLQNALGLFGQGISGAQNIFGTGANAANQLYGGGLGASEALAGELGGNLMNQANAYYAGQAQQNANRAGGFGDILGGIGSLFGL